MNKELLKRYASNLAEEIADRQEVINDPAVPLYLKEQFERDLIELQVSADIVAYFSGLAVESKPTNDS